MAYRLLADGTIECDTLQEVQALAGAKSKATSAAPVTAPKKGRRRKSGKMAAAWATARQLAKREGISVLAARKKLAAAKAK